MQNSDVESDTVISDDDHEQMNQMFLDDMEFDDTVLGILMMDDSSDEELSKSSKWGGSRKGKAANKKRDFQGAFNKLVRQYFCGRESVYDEKDFSRRFRVSRDIFHRVHDALMGKDPFIQKRDATGKLGIHPLVKLVGCFRFLGYGDAKDHFDEHLEISESSLQDLCKEFNKLVIQEFGSQYLNRCPTKEERQSISRIMQRKGFPGCIASWDCKHFDWKNCPLRLAGQFQGHGQGGTTTLILESIADHRRYIWYANFGDPGSLNDLNVLDKSSIVGAMLSGDLDLRSDPYTINGTERDWNYFLVDGIYPNWAIFVNTYQDRTDEKKNKFAMLQEAARKDIECTFGILVQKFQVLQRPLRGWYENDINDIVQSCVILHNMVQEERMGSLTNEGYEPEAEDGIEAGFPLFGKQRVTQEMAALDGVDLFSARMAAFDNSMSSGAEHYKLKQDLTQHIYALHNHMNNS